MRAMLLIGGQSLAVYTLQTGTSNHDEVGKFLEGVGRSNDSAIRGMIQLIERISREGTTSVPQELFKSWRPKKKGPRFSQLTKGDWRIGCFLFSMEKRLLLATVFSKGRQIESREYERAVKRYMRFCKNPIWKEEE